MNIIAIFVVAYGLQHMQVTVAQTVALVILIRETFQKIMKTMKTMKTIGENFLVMRKDGLLSVVQNRNYRTKDNKVHVKRHVFNVTGNVEDLEEGDILREDNLDFQMKRVKYMKDGRQHSKIIMLLYGWEKVEED